MIILSILIASLQFYKEGVLAVLASIQVGYAIYLIYILVYIRPFASYLVLISTISLEFLLTVFLLLLSTIAFYRAILNENEDSMYQIGILIIATSLISLGLELLMILLTVAGDILGAVKRFLKKKKNNKIGEKKREDLKEMGKFDLKN